MSQNKTVVPGMESGNSYGKAQPAEPYARNTYARNAAKGTVVPGMEQVNAPSHKGQNIPNPSSDSSRQSGKPVAGFLYSISRQGIGEYWPLYLGQNTIGSSPKCDICLREGTVSGEHAVIVVRKMKNPEKTIASISDTRSTNGTMVQGESLGFSAMECFNGNIITIGENYELVLLLVDVKALGLKVAEGFISIDNQPEEEEDMNVPDPYTPGYTQPGSEGMYPPPFKGSHGTYDNYNNGSNGTVGIDGRDNIKSGGTVGM